jgi:subtilisin-like proprotein convertase family protein
MSSRRITWGVAVLGTLALAFGALGVAGAKKRTKTKTFSSGNISVPIVDDDSATFAKVNVGKRGKVKDVNLSLRLDHTDLGDIELFLLSPGGKTLHFWENDGPSTSDEDLGTGSNSCAGSKTTFDDEAADDFDDLSTAPAGHVGSFKPPHGDLSTFDRSKMQGAWWLGIVDDVGGDEGTVGCAQLKIKYKKTRR